jgi:phosphoribosyl 1,2-cyclic phosphate phosphodiesterase
MKLTILGSGGSGGVPRLGGSGGAGDWGRCDPLEPRNRRLRASVLVEEGSTRVLVDASPDMRSQCLASGIDRVDAVLFTHDHADHTHGIDDLRRLHFLLGKPIPAYATAENLTPIAARFAYAFGALDANYKPFLEAREITGPFRIGDLEVTPYPQHHGNVTSTGFRFGPIAYSTDLVSLPPESYAALEGVDTWIVDSLKRTPHPTHASLDVALEMIAQVGPRRGVLTHMTIDLDYATLKAELPQGVEPAYDGMVLEA